MMRDMTSRLSIIGVAAGAGCGLLLFVAGLHWYWSVLVGLFVIGLTYEEVRLLLHINRRPT